jgi:hypothetical protein
MASLRRPVAYRQISSRNRRAAVPHLEARIRKDGSREPALVFRDKMRFVTASPQKQPSPRRRGLYSLRIGRNGRL